ncbi:PEP/pyruvate-binding domain-containing protein [Parafrankia sp. FMc2]|uniref:PEP/pyruvate-binding domain-containing protein n=1 Tax=Parafrankia sp. FMc2 TaxID=3233196 RepID=UPI0034D5B988
MSRSEVELQHAESPAPHVLPLESCSAEQHQRVGGKARGLYELIALGLPVPAGFVVTADAFRHSMSAAGADARIAALIERDDLSDDDKSRQAQKLVRELVLAPELVEQVGAAYAQLGGRPVAVRSSGIAEDTAAASFAGQHDTYLWVEGTDAVCELVVRCWASLYNANAIVYRSRFDVPDEDVAMAVVVQRMIPAVAAGVMMTLEPVTGDRSKIFIESAHGLGEGVVVGDVLSDRFWVDKPTLLRHRQSISVQTSRHAFDPAQGRVVVQDLDPEIGRRASIDEELLLEIAALGREIESAFGTAMDVEWAVSADREVFLLQARPETVWSNRPPREESRTAARTPGSPAAAERTTMHESLNPDWYYSTANLGEAAPGVLAPLSWSVWGPGAEIAARYGFVRMGVLEKAKSGIPKNPHERFVTIAFGRAVASVSAFYEMGERIPGAGGDKIAESLLGSVPDGMTSHPTKRRYLHVAWNMPRAFIRAKRVLTRQHVEIAEWWRCELARNPRLSLTEAQAQFLDACDKFQKATAVQAQGNIVAVPPVLEQLEKLVQRTGMRERFGQLTAGGGDHAETDVIADLWDLAKGRLDEAEFLARHGYHGAMEGDIAGMVWREDPEQVRRLAALYRKQDDSKDPRVTAVERAREREAAEAELLARVGLLQRPSAWLVLRLARRNMPLRGLGKVNFLRSLDIARAAARRIGALLVVDGVLDDIDDVMYLTTDELSRTIPADARALVAERKAEHARYRGYELPTAFWGKPIPAVRDIAGGRPSAGVDRVSGIGVSAGVVEGIIRVVTDPTFAEVEPGEVLVATTTDPSWAPIMLVSAALVVDIGGMLSHAAVVARELGLPCVVNSGNGTSVLRTGDRVRVDGAAGTVDVLERAR